MFIIDKIKTLFNYKNYNVISKDRVRSLFCGHKNYKILKWHWLSEIEPRRIESECICTDCGKVFYKHPENGSSIERFCIEYLSDKQEV